MRVLGALMVLIPLTLSAGKR